MVTGDDLYEIAKRFGVTVDELKAANKLASDEIEVGQKLVVAAGATEGAAASAPQVTCTLGSPDATTTISNKQLPAPDPKFGGVIKHDALEY